MSNVPSLSRRQIDALRFMQEHHISRARWMPPGDPRHATHMEVGAGKSRKRIHRDDLDAIRPFYSIGPYGNRMFVPNDAGRAALASLDQESGQ